MRRVLRAQAASGQLLSPRIYTSGLWGRPRNDRGGDGIDDRSLMKPEEVAAQYLGQTRHFRFNGRDAHR